MERATAHRDGGHDRAEPIAVLPRMLDRLAGDPPDVALTDIGGFAGPVLAHRLGVPAVQPSPACVGREGYEKDVAEHIAAVRASESGRAMCARVDAWLAEHGVPRGADELMGARSTAGAHPARDATERRPGARAGAAPVLLVAVGTACTDRLPVPLAAASVVT